MPKSVMRAVPSSATRTLPGLDVAVHDVRLGGRRRAPSASSLPILATSRTGRGPRSASTACRLRDGRYCMTRQGWPSWSTTSKTGTAFGWCRRAVMRASRMARSWATRASASRQADRGVQLLDGHGAAQALVPGQPHVSHATGADPVHEPVAPGDEVRLLAHHAGSSSGSSARAARVSVPRVDDLRQCRGRRVVRTQTSAPCCHCAPTPRDRSRPVRPTPLTGYALGMAPARRPLTQQPGRPTPARRRRARRRTTDHAQPIRTPRARQTSPGLARGGRQAGPWWSSSATTSPTSRRR